MSPEIIEKLINISKDNKYTKWYISIIELCSNTKFPKEIYCEKHHVIPKSFYKFISQDIISRKENIVRLPARYHFVAHLLLTKMFNQKILVQKMNYAFYQMKAKNKFQNKRYINSKFYDLIKRDKIDYARFYSGEKVVYVNKLDIEHYNEVLGSGMSLTMTDEYKKGRVGMMKGKTHSQDTKIKMSNTGKLVKRPWLKGRKVSEEAKNKVKETKKLRELENPDVYKEGRRITVEKRKLKYLSGELSMKGDKNPMYGIKRSAKSKKLQGEEKERKCNNGLTHIEIGKNILLPALENSTMTVPEILKLINTKWRAGYIRKILLSIDPNFDLTKVKRTPITRKKDHTTKHSEVLQRKFNNGLTYEEIYNQRILPNLQPSSKVHQLMNTHNLSMKALKNIIERFHPEGKIFWRSLF